MPKSVEDIIVPERRRSIRDIPVPSSRRRSSGPVAPTDNLKAAREVFSTPLPEKRRASRKKFLIISTIVTVVVVFGALSLFDSSALSYMPKTANISFALDAFTARKTGEDALIYSVVKLSRDGGREAEASGEEEIGRKAYGTIIVYNNASAEPQRFIATTRFESSSGLVYRAPQAIVVPGRTTVGGTTQPGSVEVLVYADEPGTKHNIGLSDFTMPGLRGTNRFDTVYARSKTPMAGGFLGMEKVVSEADKSRVGAELETSLRNELISEAVAQVPEGFVLIPSLSNITFEVLPQTPSTNTGKAQINMRGNFYGIMFKMSDLSTHLASDKIAIASTESVDLENLNNLDIKFTTTPPRDLSSVDEINFSVSGATTAVWYTDEIALKADLAGKSKKDLPTILNNYPTIVSATPTIRPFWKSSFSTDTSRISIRKLPVN